MSSSYEEILTCRTDAAMLAFRVVALTGNVVDGALEVTAAAESDVALVIGVTLDEAASGGLVAVCPLGRGGATKIAAKLSEAITIGEVVTLSTSDGLISDDGSYGIGIALSAGTSSDALPAVIEVLTFMPTAIGEES
jgi:hypothetical protein